MNDVQTFSDSKTCKKKKNGPFEAYYHLNIRIVLRTMTSTQIRSDSQLKCMDLVLVENFKHIEQKCELHYSGLLYWLIFVTG